MKTAIIADSACALPKAMCDKYDISFVPIRYVVDEDTFVDECTEDNALQMFSSGALSRKHEVTTHAPEPEDFEQAIIEKIKEGNERVIVQTLNRTQGETYANANAAVAKVKKQLDGREISVRVMDSRTVFAGQGLMAAETVRRLLKSKNEDQVRREMDTFSPKIHTYILPKEPLVALERSRTRNENSVGWTQAMIANTLGIHPIICNVNDHSEAVAKIWGFKKAAQALFKQASICVEEGLLSPLVTINYAGALSELEQLPGYVELKQLCRKKKIMLVPSVMSVTGGVYSSVGSLSLALASDHEGWH
jgi:DegV family protein with EDD domain